MLSVGLVAWEQRLGAFERSVLVNVVCSIMGVGSTHVESRWYFSYPLCQRCASCGPRGDTVFPGEMRSFLRPSEVDILGLLLARSGCLLFF